MPYTWGDFKVAVMELLTVDNDRMGTENFIAQQIRLAVLDLQRDIAKYRIGHETIYKAGDFIPHMEASLGHLPENARLRDAYVLRCKEQTIVDHNAAPVTLDPVTFTVALAAMQDGGRAKFSATTMPAGLVAGVWYWIVGATATTFQVAHEIGGDPILVTTAGVGVLVTTANEEGTCDRKPVIIYDWANRNDLIYGLVCMDDGIPRIAIDPARQTFLLYPPIVDADEDGFRYTFQLFWDGRKLDFADADAVPFDEEAVLAVADWVKGEIARHVDNDLSRWASFREPPNGPRGNLGGTYYRQKSLIYLSAQEQGRFQE